VDDAALANLTRQAERLTMAAQAAEMGFWERDLDGRVIYWDAQMYRLRGLDPDDPRPVDVLARLAMHKDDHAELLRQARRRVGHDEPYQREFRVIWPDGSTRWIASVGMAVRDASGQPTHMTGANWDITGRRHAESVLLDKEAAEQANRAKSAFLASMSHELRTPLNAVLGFAQLMQHDASHPMDALQQERVARIRAAGGHLHALIEDVLDLSSIESGSLQLAREPVWVDVAIDDVCRWIAPRAQESGIAMHVSPTGAWVLADARRVRQVIANLLTNAIKYNRPGGEVWLDARLRRNGGPAGWQIVVRDSGRGMTIAQQERLFEPFNRLGAEREGIEGVGIGLTIVRNLVELMGGRIEVASEPAHGTEFRVLLPAASPDANGPPCGPRTACVTGSACDGRPLSVLYVEDDSVNTMLVQEIVARRPDIALRCVPDGLTGVATALAAPPDVLLVDMQLPDIDGLEVLYRLKREPALAAAKFVALSANALAHDIAHALAAGFDDYWTKPVQVDRFLAGLDALAAHCASLRKTR
jgi:PAS domain S-box-containing protein